MLLCTVACVNPFLFPCMESEFSIRFSVACVVTVGKGAADPHQEREAAIFGKDLGAQLESQLKVLATMLMALAFYDANLFLRFDRNS